MSGAKSRRAHSPELKAKVGLEALRGVKTINEIAQEFGVHPVQVSQWKKVTQEHAQACSRAVVYAQRGRSSVLSMSYLELSQLIDEEYTRCPFSRQPSHGVIPAVTGPLREP